MEKGIVGTLVLVAFISCHKDRSRERFVEFYTDVVYAQRTAVDSASAVDSALAVATRHGMSAGELALFRRGITHTPEEWAAIWDEVLERLRAQEAVEQTLPRFPERSDGIP